MGKMTLTINQLILLLEIYRGTADEVEPTDTMISDYAELESMGFTEMGELSDYGKHFIETVKNRDFETLNSVTPIIGEQLIQQAPSHGLVGRFVKRIKDQSKEEFEEEVQEIVELVTQGANTHVILLNKDNGKWGSMDIREMISTCWLIVDEENMLTQYEIDKAYNNINLDDYEKVSKD